MTQRTEAKELYLAALRGDAKAQRACTSAGKPCGGRCIPKHWNCRIKGEGNTPPTRGNKVQLSAEQKQKIKEARQTRRIRAVGAVAAIAGGAAAIGALSAKNPQKSRRFFKGGPGAAAALGVAGAIPGPTRKVALAGNLGIAGAHAAGVMGASYGQNKRGRKLFSKHLAELDGVNQKLKSLDRPHTKLQEKLLLAKEREEAAKIGFANRGTNKYKLNDATRSIASQDAIRRRNLKSAETARRTAQHNLNKFYSSSGYNKLVQKQIRLKKATNRIKDILLKPYNTKGAVGGVLNDYRASYAKGFNYARRQIRGLGVASNRTGPKADPRHFSEKQQYQQDAAERTDKKCGNSGIPDKAKCTKSNTARTVAKAAAVTALVAGGAAALRAKKPSGMKPSSQRRRRTGLTKYQKEQLEKMRAKGTGKYGALGKRSTTAKQMPFYNEGDRIYPVKHKRLFRDAEAADAEGKKFSKTVTNPKTGRKRTVKYGAKGYSIAPGTNKGDRYCARSFGDMKSHNKNCAGKDRNTPLCLSRAKWKCSGKSSRRDEGEKRLGKPEEATTRQDKKCGQSGIPENWKCTKKTIEGAAKTVANNPTAVAAAVYLGAAGATLGTGLLAARNARIRGKLKFGGDDRITPFKGVIGDADKVMQGFTAKQTGGDSMFGDVLIGKGKDGQDLVIKKITGSKNNLNPFADPVAQMQKQGIIDAKTASNLKKQRQNIMESEVKLAKVAGEVGFGPKVVAAKKNTLIMEVAKGKPLMDKYVNAGPLGITAKKQELSRSDKAQVLTAMAKMHTAGVAHNDMHLGNTFTTGKGAEFIDFGTAQQGGGPVAMEFVRQMNKPRVGETYWQGNGYNLKTLDPKGYRRAEGKIRKAIGKRIGTLRDNDIAKAVEKNPSLAPVLQGVVDDYYQGLVPARNDASEKRGKACGNSYIPKAHNCSKGSSAEGQPVNKKAIAAAVAIGAVGAMSIGVAMDARQLKKGFGIPPTDDFRSTMKGVMKEKGIKDIQQASGAYYDKLASKEGWKTGELVYTRSGKGADFSHFAVYMGKKNGVHSFAQIGADGITAKTGSLQVTQYGPGVPPGNRGAAIFARPPKEFQAKKTLSAEEIATRIDRMKGKTLKYEAFSDNCESWARTIVGDGTRSQQANKLTLTTKTAIRGVYRGLEGVVERWGDTDDFPVSSGPVTSAKSMARMLDRQDPRGNVGAFAALLSNDRRDDITSNHIGLIPAEQLLDSNMSAIEAVARVKRYLMLVTAIVVDMEKHGQSKATQEAS